jgi:flagellin
VTGNPILGATNNAIRLQQGQNYESYKTEITSLINQNVTQAGRNLLLGQNVSIILNEFSANAITVSGVNTSVAGNLALTTNGSTWTTNGNISASQTQVQAAMQVVNGLQAQFGTYSSFVKARYDINQTFSSDLKSLGDDLVAADVAEESAKLTALQTQQQFAVQAFSAGSQNAQGLLRLLG